MDSFTFEVPLKVRVSRNKSFILNLNNYRNAHHRVLSTAKRNYTDIVCNISMPNIIWEKVTVHYKIFPRTKRLYDGMNVISIVDKFVCDALTKRGIIPDDNIKHVVGTTWEACNVDKHNPRIEVTLTLVN